MENVAWRQRLECCGHKPRHVKSHQKLLGEVRNGFSSRASGGGMASDNSFQTFGLQNCKWIHLLGVHLPSLCSFAAATPKKLMWETILTSSSFSSAVSRNRSGRKGFTPLQFSTLKIFSDGMRTIRITRKNAVWRNFSSSLQTEWVPGPGWGAGGIVAEPRLALNKRMWMNGWATRGRGLRPSYTQGALQLKLQTL